MAEEGRRQRRLAVCATASEITLGAAPMCWPSVSAMSGEPGWELHVPTEYAAHVYERLWEAGQTFGITNVGYRAIDTLRMEKGYRLLEQRHHARLHAVRGRTRLPRLAEEERFRRTGCARRGQAAGPRSKRLCTFALERFTGAVGSECDSAQWHGAGRDHQRQLRPYDHGKPIAYGYIPGRSRRRTATSRSKVFGEPDAATAP